MAVLDIGNSGDSQGNSVDANVNGSAPTPEFFQSISEERRSDPGIQNFKSVDDLVKSYLETKKMIGDPAVLRAPKDPGQKAEWIKATRPKLVEMGLMEAAPESADKYQITMEGVEPEVISADVGIKAFLPIAHKLGLSNAQAQGMVQAWPEIAAAIMPKMVSQDEAVKVLSQEFGASMPAKLSSAQNAVKQLSAKLPELTPWLEDQSRGWLGNDPVFIKTMATIGEMLGQDNSGAASHQNTGESVESIDDKIRAVRGDATLNPDVRADKLLALYRQKATLLKQSGVRIGE